MTDWQISETRDVAALAEFFRIDPILYTYKLGDLDPLFFDDTRWWIAKRDGKIDATLLLYTAFDTPIIQALSDNSAQAELWLALVDQLPDYSHSHYRADHESILREHWDIEPVGLMNQMRWTGTLAEGIDTSIVATLSEADVDEIDALKVRTSSDTDFDRRVLPLGLCVGVYQDDRLMSFGACHVFSQHYRVAALGAIMTDPEARGSGYATAVTQELVRKLQEKGASVMLNVHSENAPAIHIYEKLGFVKHSEYVEAYMRRR